MMKFNNPIPRGGMPRWHESSPQRIHRDSDAVQRSWKKSRAVTAQADATQLALQELARQVNRLRLRAAAAPDGRRDPFQIVRGGDWLTFQVARNEGQIILNGDPLAVILGTMDADIAVPSGTLRFWFYFQLTSTSATLTTALATPTWDATQVPIGYVDTATHAVDSRSDINQFLYENYYNPCVP